MRCGGVVLVMSATFLFSVSSCAAQSSVNNSNEIQPLTCNQVAAWLAGGVSSQRVERMTHEYGISFSVDASVRESLKKVGAEASLLDTIGHSQGKDTANCSPKLVKAGSLIRNKNYPDAEAILRRLVEDAPANSALHFALAYVRQQQGDWDEAYDEYSEAKQYMPALPEVHSRLAYDFYVSHDGDNTIAEARTALSLDPQNAEGYRDLGLGLYSNEKYDAALYAFRESLALQPNNPETNFGIAMTQEARHNLKAAMSGTK